MSYRIPLFDIDGTIVEGGNKAHMGAYDYAMQSVYGQSSASVSEIQIDGMIDTQIIVEVLRLHGVSEGVAKAKMPQAIAAMDRYFDAHKREGKPVIMPGVVELLTALSERNIPIGLLTGNTESIGWGKVGLAGLSQFFQFGSFGSLAYRRVDLIPLAVSRAKEHGIDAHLKDLVIVGDTPLDVASAKAGGIPSIAVGAGRFSPQELRNVGADLVVDACADKDRILGFLQVH
jgi:phosphoglycolate phosphatase